MKSITNDSIIEFYEKKSKFIGYAKRIKNKEDGEKFIEEIKLKHKDATHNCSVYRVITNGVEYFKADDDGEPSGTAGKPMGEIINLLGVCNVVVIATRYFGGIKLGAGGLVRNYAKTAKLAIEAGIIQEYFEKINILLDFDYEKAPEVEQVIKKKNIEILDKNYGERVTLKVILKKEELEEICKIRGVLIIES